MPFDKKLACRTNYQERRSFPWPLVIYKEQWEKKCINPYLANNQIREIKGRRAWPVMNSLIKLNLDNNFLGESLVGGRYGSHLIKWLKPFNWFVRVSAKMDNQLVCGLWNFLQLSKLRWMPNSVCIGFDTAMKTGSSRQFKRYPTTYMWVSSWLLFTVD